MITAQNLRELAENRELIEAGRIAIECTLIDMRDHRIGHIGRGNGFVCREKGRYT